MPNFNDIASYGNPQGLHNTNGGAANPMSMFNSFYNQETQQNSNYNPAQVAQPFNPQTASQGFGVMQSDQGLIPDFTGADQFQFGPGQGQVTDQLGFGSSANQFTPLTPAQMQTGTLPAGGVPNNVPSVGADALKTATNTGGGKSAGFFNSASFGDFTKLASAGIGAYLGMEQLGLAQDQFDFSKQAYEDKKKIAEAEYSRLKGARNSA